MQDSKENIFAAMIFGLVSAACALLFYLGLLEQPTILALFVCLVMPRIMFTPLLSASRTALALSAGSPALGSAYVALAFAMFTPAINPISGHPWDALWLFLFFLSFLWALFLSWRLAVFALNTR